MDFKKISLGEFKDKFSSEKNRRVKERLHILLLLREGYTQREVSEMLHVSVGKVPFWKCRFDQEGFEGLNDKSGRGRKSTLSEMQLGMMRSALEEPILMENGYSRGWQTKDLIHFIRNQFGVSYTTRNIRYILSRFGLVRLVPRPRNMSRNQEDVDAFKKKSHKDSKV